VAGLLDPKKVAGLPAVREWLKHAETTERVVRENYADLPPEHMLMAAIEENVLVQLEHLRTLPSVAARLVKGTLRLHGWVYQIETGEVYAFDAGDEQFVPLAEYEYPAEEASVRRRTIGLI
jgi:carbonic anhydrase